VWRGCVKIAEQGYWRVAATVRFSPSFTGRKTRAAPYARGRTAEGHSEPAVTLVEGDPTQIAVIQWIFHEFVDLGYSNTELPNV